MKVLLDTDAYSQLKRGHARVVEHVRASEKVFLSAIVAGELIHGFRYGSRFEKKVRELHEFLAHPLCGSFRSLSHVNKGG